MLISFTPAPSRWAIEHPLRPCWASASRDLGSNLQLVPELVHPFEHVLALAVDVQAVAADPTGAYVRLGRHVFGEGGIPSELIVLEEQHARSPAPNVEPVERVELGPFDIDDRRVDRAFVTAEELVDRAERYRDGLFRRGEHRHETRVLGVLVEIREHAVLLRHDHEPRGAG